MDVSFSHQSAGVLCDQLMCLQIVCPMNALIRIRLQLVLTFLLSSFSLVQLGALAFEDVFTAGCSLYGVADLSALAGDTHKFESR